MGDEVHNRNAAATALLFKRLAPAAAHGGHASRAGRRDARISSPATTTSSSTCRWPRARRCSTPPHGVPASSMVTAMARNGVNFGIRLSRHRRSLVRGARESGRRPLLPRLLASPMPPPISATPRSPRPPASAASRWPPRRRSCKFVGGTPADALASQPADARHHARRAIRRSRCPRSTSPRAPAGIDARKVVDRGILPVINTGIAHREAGVGQIGAGITAAPMACFSAGGRWRWPRGAQRPRAGGRMT